MTNKNKNQKRKKGESQYNWFIFHSRKLVVFKCIYIKIYFKIETFNPSIVFVIIFLVIVDIQYYLSFSYKRTWQILFKSDNGTCIKNMWTKPKGGRIQGGRWGWLGQRGVVGGKWRQLYLNNNKKCEKKESDKDIVINILSVQY